MDRLVIPSSGANGMNLRRNADLPQEIGEYDNTLLRSVRKLAVELKP